MPTRVLLAAAGLALAMLFVAAPAVAQDAPPAPPPAAKKKPEPLRGPAAEAARAASGSAPVAEAADGEDAASEQGGATPAPAPRAPSATPLSPPRPLGQPGRLGRASLPTRTDPRTGKQIVVISNADLERLYGTSVVPVSSSAPGAAPAPGSAPRTDPANAGPEDAAGGGSGGNGAARVAEIDAEIKRLNDNARSMANPFLPPPKLTDAEKAALDGKDNRERVDMTRERIKELQQEKARLESSPSGEEPSGR